MPLQPQDVSLTRIKENITAYSLGQIPLEKRIAGLQVSECSPRLDDRQFFLEIGRDTGIFKDFPFRQANYAQTDAGVIKAFHYHLHQQDIFFFISGKARVPLVDLRVNSPTYGIANTFFAGPPVFRAIRIPEGVAHGYEALTEVRMMYFVNQTYNPQDERRIEPGTKEFRKLGYRDWGRKNR
jgi:dTDP-4-dehydrorhamnose 3,5-epimerase